VSARAGKRPLAGHTDEKELTHTTVRLWVMHPFQPEIADALARGLKYVFKRYGPFLRAKSVCPQKRPALSRAADVHVCTWKKRSEGSFGLAAEGGDKRRERKRSRREKKRARESQEEIR